MKSANGQFVKNQFGKKEKTLRVASEMSIFDKTAKVYDEVSFAISFGIVRLWEREVLKRVSGERVIDIGCGTGRLLERITANLKVGVDYSLEMLKVARKRNKDFFLVRGDAHRLPFKDNLFDCGVISLGLRHFENPEVALKEARRVLKKGGKLVVLEAGLPEVPLLKGFLKFFLKNLVSPTVKLVFGKETAKHLVDSVVEFPSGENFKKLARKAGLSVKETSTAGFGFGKIYVLEPL